MLYQYFFHSWDTVSTVTKLRALTAGFSCKNKLKQHKVYCSEVLTLMVFGFI
jgi:hypothetical protein